MYELKEDIFYKKLENYVLDVEYCIVKDDILHRHEMHGKALLFAIQKLGIEQYSTVIKSNASYEKEEGKDSKWISPPWDFPYDIQKAKSTISNAKTLLYLPNVIGKNSFGYAIYDTEWKNDNSGGKIPYWYAFLEPPHGASLGHPESDTFIYERGVNPDDFKKLNNDLFPNGTDSLEVYDWSTDWSEFFSSGQEWWGTMCYTIYDASLNRYVVMMASSTD